ncbi:hypothetical protein BR63_09350 [Thermanaerosceptrum fracticalcis]|uniref:Uncharacterized protein n=1 Tax=Thermanaerosceptrum fracticalcis TaxID=1712410 RepID=A0A7G6E344_THEFR|nr:hypothetical protein [Thermanaerosceptrum fracticalcis]QNB46498.1 hypothetical protein BR63_09350 [Thermanaerosceptrum fracticalcis]
MSLTQMLQIMSALPQIVETIKKMGPGEKDVFVQSLGLEGEEKEAAYTVITRFQEGKQLSPDEQVKAQILLEKALKMNNMDLSTLLNMGMKK